MVDDIQLHAHKTMQTHLIKQLLA